MQWQLCCLAAPLACTTGGAASWRRLRRWLHAACSAGFFFAAKRTRIMHSTRKTHTAGQACSAIAALADVLVLAAAPSRPWLTLALSPRAPQALGINDDSLFGVLFGIGGACFFAFAQWSSYQDDIEDDFFDTYDSRRVDREITNRNRV